MQHLERYNRFSTPSYTDPLPGVFPGFLLTLAPFGRCFSQPEDLKFAVRRIAAESSPGTVSNVEPPYTVNLSVFP